MALDITQPERGVLPDGSAYVETRSGDLLRQQLIDQGWSSGDTWTSLRLDLSEPVEDSGLRVETVRLRSSSMHAPLFSVQLLKTLLSLKKSGMLWLPVCLILTHGA
jgi:hypothetical protein